MREAPTPETDSVTRSSDETPWTPWVCAGHAKRLERERDEAMNSLKWIAGRYCHEKTTFQLAQEAYEMSSKARWTLQKIEQTEEAK